MDNWSIYTSLTSRRDIVAQGGLQLLCTARAWTRLAVAGSAVAKSARMQAETSRLSIWREARGRGAPIEDQQGSGTTRTAQTGR
jgi:hypothetical protein